MEELCEQIMQDYKNGKLDKSIADIIMRMIKTELDSLEPNLHS